MKNHPEKPGKNRPTSGVQPHFRHNTDIGQNFLRDHSVVEWMMARAGLSQGDRVLEIGPGKGILTRGILRTNCAHLDAIELDTRLRPDLESIAAQERRLSLHWGDAVRYDYASISDPPTHIIANLPYHITTPLIWKLLETFSGGDLRYLLLMVQYEAASRLISGAGTRESNPLSVTIAAIGEAEMPRRVSRGAFTPMPRVDSALVEIKLDQMSERNRPLLPNDAVWRRLLAGSFAARRKTLVNNWSRSFGMPRDLALQILAACGLPPHARPEELSLSQWFSLRDDEAMVQSIQDR